MQHSRMRAFLDHQGWPDYERAWQWSVDPLTSGHFWAEVAKELSLPWDRGDGPAVIADASSVPGVRWFPGARINYARAALSHASTHPDGLAVTALSQTRGPSELTWSELADLVARLRAGLAAHGVGRGDRVAGYLPNIPETLAVMLAAASLGAVWTCCAPEVGVAGALDRLSQVDPKVLLAVDGYRYGERKVERRQEVEAIRAGLPTVGLAVWLPYLHPDGGVPAGWTPWAELAADRADPEYLPLPFDHPLYILYSSGTTGRPKPIVHGHGGIVLEHAKVLALHFDLGPDDRFFWFTTTGWMMWNFCISGLLIGSSVVLFDGDPSWPTPDELWSVVASTGTTCAGVGAGYLTAAHRRPGHPGEVHDLAAMRTLGSTGSPLPASTAEWVYAAVSGDVMLASLSGGTDVCTGFVGTSPLHPVWAGEISCRCLGADVEVLDARGRPVVGEEGELVLARPMPSMPVGFWGDADGARYRSTYFEQFPGIWAHGDRATLTPRGTVVITGRSDGTLNRGGVRMGTAEFYAVVEGMEGVTDSLVVHAEDPSGGPGLLWLFVVPAQGSPDKGLADRITATLRRDLSPRHVPDRIVEVPAIPRTLSGKKMEVPVKRILSGVPLGQALTLTSVANPESIETFVRLAPRAPDPD